MISSISTRLVCTAALVVAVGCTRDATNHPEHGMISSLSVDWTTRGEGTAVPPKYNVKIGEYSTTLEGDKNRIDNKFFPGRYAVCVYNAASGVSVDGTVASFDYYGPVGEFFIGTSDVTLDRDRDHEVTVAMRQLTRRLTLELAVSGDAADRLEGVSGSLSGVAQAVAVADGAPTGSKTFAPFRFANDGGKFSASLHVPAICGDTQILSLTLDFRDDNPMSYAASCDLSDKLSNFNTDKLTPLVLSSVAAITPTEVGLSTSIADWTLGEETSGVAD